MPQHTGRDGAPRAPRSGDATDALRVWKRSHPLDLAHRCHQRQVAVGPDVGPAERHQQVDVRGPRADASQPDQRGPRVFIIERRERVGVELARDDRLRELFDVAALLPSESSAAQVGLGERSDPLGRHGPGKSFQPSVGGAASGQRYLLLQDDLDEGPEAGRTIPQWWRAVTLDNGRQMRVATRKLSHALGQARGG
jgi:hypothetical protein